MRKHALASLAVLAFALAFSETAHGCVCALSSEKLSPEKARAALVTDFNGAAAVFSGKVVEADKFKLKFKVNKVWKGEVGKEFVMSTGAKEYEDGSYSTSSCDYSFERGEEYLVYAYPVDPDTHPGSTDLQARQCTRTRLAKQAKQEMKELDEITVQPDSSTRNLMFKRDDE
ncbi:MAG TPA: hypothetical protein VGX24_11900 [Pyrinomonadaceae bacterium]|jgi:hypothetical protein|nr:hypothetical protein [Pyrinomonadaceae bacterium]